MDIVGHDVGRYLWEKIPDLGLGNIGKTCNCKGHGFIGDSVQSKRTWSAGTSMRTEIGKSDLLDHKQAESFFK